MDSGNDFDSELESLNKEKQPQQPEIISKAVFLELTK